MTSISLPLSCVSRYLQYVYSSLRNTMDSALKIVGRALALLGWPLPFTWGGRNLRFFLPPIACSLGSIAATFSGTYRFEGDGGVVHGLLGTVLFFGNGIEFVITAD